MRKSDFTDYLIEIKNLNQEAISVLDPVLEKFPYFSAAHILKSKALKKIDSIELEKQLRIAAAYSGDRKQLQSHLTNIESDIVTDLESEIIIESKDIIEEENIYDNTLEQQILVEAINSSILQEIPNEIEEKNELIEEEEIVTEKPSFDTETLHSFSSWLGHFSNQKVEFIKPQNEKLVAISQAAKSIQKKAEFYSASKMAKLSVQEDDDLITETLANVYVSQANYQKAIIAFEKLQLKFPEKKIYFAGRIKEVQLLAKS